MHVNIARKKLIATGQEQRLLKLLKKYLLTVNFENSKS